MHAGTEKGRKREDVILLLLPLLPSMLFSLLGCSLDRHAAYFAFDAKTNLLSFICHRHLKRLFASVSVVAAVALDFLAKRLDSNDSVP